VETPWFSSLDDDDHLLPEALLTRVRALQESEACDAVVTNGYCRGLAGDVPIVADMALVAANPLRALKDSNWLLPGAWLCRTSETNRGLFHGMPRQLECTYLAIRLVTTQRVRFIDEPTVVWQTDSPGSASKTRSYTVGQPAALRRILELDLPPDVRRCFQARLGAACHASSVLMLESGMTLSAWKQHVLALFERDGWRYLPFTRRLIARSLAASRRPAE
jgi:hypothetical protein